MNDEDWLTDKELDALIAGGLTVISMVVSVMFFLFILGFLG